MDNDIIDKIQDVRKNNNILWMDILRIAFELDKEKAKCIMQKITENDSKINKLTKELSE